MLKLKLISKESIPYAFEKAERYRLMKEPASAESICLDILEVDPENQNALITLILSLSEQFKQNIFPAFSKSQEMLAQIHDEYERFFYSGVIYERRAMAHLTSMTYNSGRIAYQWFHRAMENYEKAIEIRPPKNDDAILRWNTCARIIMRDPTILPLQANHPEHMLE